MALKLLIAAMCVGLIGIVFMNLSRSSARARLASSAGIFWLFFVFLVTAADHLTR